MIFEIIPIESFLGQMMAHPRVTAVTAEWRVEPGAMVRVLGSYFRDIGFFHVTCTTQSRILNIMVQQLRASPEIALMVRKADVAEADRKKALHVA